jgi:hypothetical protein
MANGHRWMDIEKAPPPATYRTACRLCGAVREYGHFGPDGGFCMTYLTPDGERLVLPKVGLCPHRTASAPYGSPPFVSGSVHMDVYWDRMRSAAGAGSSAHPRPYSLEDARREITDLRARLDALTSR